MERYLVKLQGKIKIASETYAFILEKPEGFLYKPGQYMEVRNNDESHDFSIASAPHEKYIMFATRIRSHSKFKRGLMEFTEGSQLMISNASGNFTLPRERHIPIVFIVGGIGITPVRSMVKSEEKDKSERSITIIYSNRTPEEAPFLEELESVALSKYRFIPTMTNLDESKTKWSGEVGYINRVMLEKYVDSLKKTVFYIVGAPKFVTAMNDLLSSIEQIPSTHIKAEDFAGY